MRESVSSIVNQEPEFEVIINEPGRSFRWHQHDYPSPLAKWNYHPEYELHLITKSQGTMFVGDCIENFRPGNLCLIGPNIPHNWTSNRNSNQEIKGRDVALQFTRQSIGLEAKTCPLEMIELKKLLDRSHLGLVFEGGGVDEAITLMKGLGELEGLAAFATVLQIMSILSSKAESRELVSTLYRPNLNQETTAWMQVVFEEISENLSQNIKLSDLSDKVGMTESTFSRFFKRNCGLKFSSYLRKLRIGRACSLLSETENKIVDIGIDSGFQNLSNFNRNFKEHMGMTPNEYRSMARQR